MIDRDGRGPVQSVDYPRMLQRYAEDYDLIRANRGASFVAAAGARRVLESLTALSISTAVTGSFSAARLAPVAAPALLALYCGDRDQVATTLGLLPADEGANIVLLDPFDPVVWDRLVVVDGVTYVSPAQSALDCLAGNGRMPSEGTALLEWMLAHEPDWRAGSLSDVPGYSLGIGG